MLEYLSLRVDAVGEQLADRYGRLRPRLLLGWTRLLTARRFGGFGLALGFSFTRISTQIKCLNDHDRKCVTIG